ncbi:D-methionine transport system ATP-binding protein [Austwickia chelonae]|uniref:Putative ABC transporter ATP-binding protein n=1 Tax=Austwickia chelonae NBRC 105200 TaxID=1184607 RepID=K6V7L5_9MICO|nr:methionine ABC transporter ATP-binding protein [Austwickia chelonae]GAB78223.1 putative ABC transporter ATP-binding protein [Austwickia chelonae NBRC 105200]SEV99018.1 D-methionine transport system ATP-binding protein [Austwickia chelonae]
MITLDHVTKIYSDRGTAVTAVDDISLTIQPGQIFGILGRSGAGKTTLLRCLNLLERPTSGSITVDGLDLTSTNNRDLRAARQRIGTVFQHFNLMSNRTAAQNIAFPLEVTGTDKNDRADRVAELLDLVGLADRGDKYPSELSGGQKQRVGIARALAARPSVLLSDEATSALDPATTEQILDLFKAVNQATGVTVVLITHEAEVVRRICDSAALMEAGRFVEQGPLLDLVADPDSRLAEILLPTGDHDLTIPGRHLTLSFADERAVEPTLSRLSADLGVELSVLGGTLERVAGRQVGRLRVTYLPGAVPDETVTSYLRDRGVTVKAA